MFLTTHDVPFRDNCHQTLWYSVCQILQWYLFVRLKCTSHWIDILRELIAWFIPEKQVFVYIHACVCFFPCKAFVCWNLQMIWCDKHFGVLISAKTSTFILTQRWGGGGWRETENIHPHSKGQRERQNKAPFCFVYLPNTHICKLNSLTSSHTRFITTQATFTHSCTAHCAW